MAYLSKRYLASCYGLTKGSSLLSKEEKRELWGKVNRQYYDAENHETTSSGRISMG